ncbi:MAG: histidinol-phosphate transaminase [Deferribacteraceae bacterium]|jgi:histidinol-phosphate aminotransferase|nr:histidinol-phosphate transaminase [Deferribacteraceae bacterium]
MIDYAKLAGKDIASLVAYQPGKPIDELKREYGLTDIIKLASNENPFGPSPKVLEAVKASLDEICRYPLGDAFHIRAAVAKNYDVPTDCLVFGSGSNEIIELLLRTYVKAGEHVVSPSPSFSVYGIIAQAMQTSCNWIPTGARFEVDLERLLAAINAKTRVVFLANPNNPTGTYIPENDLRAFVKRVPEETIIVMDEAYIEFADATDIPNTVHWYKEQPNMVMMRTFSKAYGLAGLRIGYMIGDAACCAMMNRVRQPFNTNMLAQVAAVAAIHDTEYLQNVIAGNLSGKKYLYEQFEALDLDYIPSQSNFIMVNVGNGKKVFESLLAKGVIARFYPAQGEYIRITIGTQKENETFISALKAVL